jgi:hypothetical protein
LAGEAVIGACLCPDVALEATHPIPSTPLTCGCCGEPLELTCAGRCGEQHVRAAFAAAAPPKRIIERVTVEKREHRCGRCEAPLPKRTGRPAKYCDDCLTPRERELREAQRAANEAARKKRLEAVPS